MCKIANKHTVNYAFEQRLARGQSNKICSGYIISSASNSCMQLYIAC